MWVFCMPCQMLRKKLILSHFLLCAPYDTMPLMCTPAMFHMVPNIERHITWCSKNLSNLQILLLIKRSPPFYIPKEPYIPLLLVLEQIRLNQILNEEQVKCYSFNMPTSAYVVHITLSFCTITLDVHIFRLTAFYQVTAPFSV